MSLNESLAHAPVAATDAADAPDLRQLAGRDSFVASLSMRWAGCPSAAKGRTPKCREGQDARERPKGRTPVSGRLRYEWQGPEDAPLLLVAGGISAHRHLGASRRYPEPGWWPRQAGPGLALDSQRYRLLAIDWLGAAGELDAPIDSADQADAIAAVLDRIGVRRAAAFVGCSYGAMVGLQFAARHGHRLGALLAISGGARAHPYASAWRALQRQVLALGRSEAGNREALSLARQLALLSYRTPEEFAERFDAPTTLVDGRARCAAEDWLQARGAAFVARSSPTAYARLSESIDLHQLDPATVTVPTVLVAVEEDRLVPRADLVALAEQLPAARRLHLLRSRFGHDAFLVEHEAIARILRATLAECAS